MLEIGMSCTPGLKYVELASGIEADDCGAGAEVVMHLRNASRQVAPICVHHAVCIVPSA